MKYDDNMIDTLIKSILIGCLCWLAARYFFPPLISFITRKNSFFRKSVKPFECSFCLSWWSAFIYFVYIGEVWCIAAAATSAIVAGIIEKKL
jgi:hypothetical protein